MDAGMTMKVRKQKNAAFLALPLRLLIEFKLKIGSSLAVFKTPEGLLLRPVRRRYNFARPASKPPGVAPTKHIKSLEERLVAFDLERHGGEAMAVRPAGKEIL